ncbi:MAG: hypothetical protein ACM3QZ_01925 [Solirubrobacterales bacterium]
MYHKDDAMIEIPSGRLNGFYWYENNPTLYAAEKAAMAKFFPRFSLNRLSDGRLYWLGTVEPKSLRPNAVWTLQVIYDHDHPNNNRWGGSIQIYSVDPDLDEMSNKLGGIPHTIRDGSTNRLYICTSRAEDFKITRKSNYSAATALSWAVKWIAVFELWLAGDITTEQFSGHTF